MSIFSRGPSFQIPQENGWLLQAAAADLNGDGFPDLVLAWEVGIGTQEQPIQIELNNKNGSFIDGSSLISGPLPTVAHPQQIIIANLQGSNQPDIFVADHGYDGDPFPGHQQRLLEWNAQGKLFDASARLPQQLTFTHRASVGDIDGNGTLDLLYANLPPSARPQILLNSGGLFATSGTALPTSVVSGNGNTGGLLKDLNRDGVADLVLGGWDPLHSGFHPSVVYLNDGHGNFTDANATALPAPPIPLVNGIGPTALDIVSGDLTGDGNNDLAIDWTNGDYTAHFYQVLVNDGSGHFTDQTASLFPQSQNGYWTVHLYLASLHNNGVLDIVAQPSNTAAPTVYLNDGSGHFSFAESFGDPGDIITPFVQNGRTDFVGLHLNGLGYVYQNTIASPSAQSLNVFYGGDFNADNHGDVLFQTESGFLGMWEMNGNQILASPGIGPLPAGANVAGIGDFNADSHSDILFQTNTGFLGMWQMNGSQILASPGIGALPAAAKVAGVGDFDGDGHGDILFQTNTGFLGMWKMNGSQILASPGIGALPAGAHVAGIGDFNADGRSDILFQTDSGFLGMWQMNGSQVLASPGIGALPAAANVAGVGDFDGDGRSDILFQTNTGFLGMWKMSGSQILASPGIGALPGNANVAEIADFNNDGHDDVMFQTNTGFLGMWEMNGSQILASPGVGPLPANAHVVPHLDLF